MGTVLLWAEARSPTDVQALNAAALCRSEAVLSSIGSHTTRDMVPQKERPHTGPAPPTLEDWMGLPSHDAWPLPQ